MAAIVARHLEFGLCIPGGRLGQIGCRTCCVHISGRRTSCAWSLQPLGWGRISSLCALPRPARVPAWPSAYPSPPMPLRAGSESAMYIGLSRRIRGTRSQSSVYHLMHVQRD